LDRLFCLQAGSVEQHKYKRQFTFVIFDLGCTKSMGSIPEITAFSATCAAHGMTVEFSPTRYFFSFANRDTTQITEKCWTWFPTSPPCSTDVDICDEGNVLILLSLSQMGNLRLTSYTGSRRNGEPRTTPRDAKQNTAPIDCKSKTINIHYECDEHEISQDFHVIRICSEYCPCDQKWEYVSTHTFKYMHTHTYICTHIYVCAYIYIGLHLHRAYASTRTCVCMHAYTCIYTHIYGRVSK